MFRTVEREATGLQSLQGPRALRYGFGQTPVGVALVAWSEQTIWYLALAAQDRIAALQDLQAQRLTETLQEDPDGSAQILRQVFDLPSANDIAIAIHGTPFQRKVWNELLRIKRAEQVSYGEIAARLGVPGAARAVGSAVGANRIAYLIPCHRVVRKSGESARFRWGLDIKRQLSQWEAAGTCV